jgi:hypothetical protein
MVILEVRMGRLSGLRRSHSASQDGTHCYDEAIVVNREVTNGDGNFVVAGDDDRPRQSHAE